MFTLALRFIIFVISISEKIIWSSFSLTPTEGGFNQIFSLFCLCKPLATPKISLCHRLFLFPLPFFFFKVNRIFIWLCFIFLNIKFWCEVSSFYFHKPPNGLQFHFPLFVFLMFLFHSTVMSVNWLLFFTFKFCLCGLIAGLSAEQLTEFMQCPSFWPWAETYYANISLEFLYILTLTWFNLLSYCLKSGE